MIERKDNRKKRPNAWKRYGALAMAGMLIVGAVSGSGKSYAAGQEAAKETEKRVTLNIAGEEDDTEAEEASDVQTEEETEKRVTLNVVDDAKAEKKDEAQEETEGAAGEETEAAETETEAAEEETRAAEKKDDAADDQTEAEEPQESFAPIANASIAEGAVVTTDVTGVVENCMPTIVSITGKSVEEIETYYYGTQQFEAESAASGIIVAQNEEELLVATNSHVVEGLTEINVCFTAEAEDAEDLVASAKLKGMDRDNELAVLAVRLSDIPEDVREQLRIARLGSSEDLKVGQAAIAIGNALGYGQSVTSGIISALNREITLDNFSKEVIVTDAAINFGNSGGALLNADGEVIGINVAKETGQGTESMGYSIPIDTAIPVLNELVNRETRDRLSNEERGYMGATVVNVSADAKDLYDMPQGAFVYEVAPDSAAEKAGIRKGDIITKFDGVTVTSHDDLIDKMSYYAVGETVTVELQRASDGAYESREAEVTLQEGAPAAADVSGSAEEDGEEPAPYEELPEEQDEYFGEEGSFFDMLPFGGMDGWF